MKMQDENSGSQRVLTLDIPSPCIGICKIEGDNPYCSGCLRTRHEIKIWRSADHQQRLDILKSLKQRRHAVGRIGKGERHERRRK